MKPASVLLLYLVLIFCTAAVVSPLVFWLVGGFVQWPFHRYVDRILMISAAAWLVFFWKSFGLRTWAEVNILWRTLPSGVVRGMVVGLLVAGMIFGLMLGFHARVWVGLSNPALIPIMILGFLILACFEEGLFRGVAQTIFIRQFGLVGGVILTTLVFVVMHFVKVPSDFSPNPVHWYSGWVAIGLSLSAFSKIGWLGGYLNVLVLLGGVLSLCVLNFRSLGPAIGVHAGLIIGQHLIEEGSRSVDASGWLSQPMNANPLTQVLLALLLALLFFRFLRHGKN